MRLQPTLLHAKYLSLRFRQQSAFHTMRNHEVMLIQLIEGLYQISYGKEKPRWFPL